MAKRVVVTGIGMVTPLGPDTRTTWEAILSGTTAVCRCAFHSSIPAGLAAQVDRSRLSPVSPLLSPCPDFATFALLAAHEALLDAALLAPHAPNDTAAVSAGGLGYDPTRAGVALGVGVGQVQELVTAAAAIANGQYRRVSPFLVPRILPNTPSGLVGLRYSLRGPTLSPATACAAGAHAVAEGFYAIQRGDADVMVVGGTEAVIGDVSVAGFARAKALTGGWKKEPWRASRPFDRRRDGFVIGEGAGLLVLESAEHARGRGVAGVYAEVVGVGLSGDAHHITSPAPDGDGAVRAMRAAVEGAGREMGEVDYVNAHATSTQVGDAVERRAIAEVLDGRRVGLRAVVSSTKGAVGHLLGAAGGVEAGFTALSVAEGVVAPTVNLEEMDRDEGVEEKGWGGMERYVAGRSRAMEVGLALSNSFGFGGTNTCLAFAKADAFAQKTVLGGAA